VRTLGGAFDFWRGDIPRLIKSRVSDLIWFSEAGLEPCPSNTGTRKRHNKQHKPTYRFDAGRSILDTPGTPFLNDRQYSRTYSLTSAVKTATSNVPGATPQPEAETRRGRLIIHRCVGPLCRDDRTLRLLCGTPCESKHPTQQPQRKRAAALHAGTSLCDSTVAAPHNPRLRCGTL
jgi:hypothetical protein